jgi:hypothetical protein
LKRCWEYLAGESGPVSLESAVRVIFLSWLFDQPARAPAYARWAVGELRLRAAERKKEADDIGAHLQHLQMGSGTPSTPVLALAYRGIMRRAEAGMTEAEADKLEAAAIGVEEFFCGFLARAKQKVKS